MNYFEKLKLEAEKLDKRAEEYLARFEFINNEACVERIFLAAKRIFEKNDENWSAVPWWVADTMDGRVPFSTIPRNGSLGFALGFSPLAMDANLRNLLEIAEEREEEELNLPLIAKVSESD